MFCLQLRGFREHGGNWTSRPGRLFRSHGRVELRGARSKRSQRV